MNTNCILDNNHGKLLRRVERLEISVILIVIYLAFFSNPHQEFSKVEDSLTFESENTPSTSNLFSQPQRQQKSSILDLRLDTNKLDNIEKSKSQGVVKLRKKPEHLDYLYDSQIREPENHQLERLKSLDHNDMNSIYWRDLHMLSTISVPASQKNNIDDHRQFARRLQTSGSPPIACNGNQYRIDLHVENEILEDDLFRKEVAWELIDLSSNTDILLNSLESEVTSSASSYFSCLDSGKYKLTFFDGENKSIKCSSCYQMLVNNTEVILGNDFIGQSKHFFYISKDGIGREQICPNVPKHSPVTFFNDFQYDESVAKVLDVIYSLSSTDAIHTRGTPQYKATCWIIHDDIVESEDLDNYFVERYTMAVILYALNQDAELLPMKICNYDESKVRCGSRGFVEEIDFDAIQTKGFIPSEIAHLKFLKTLSLWGNELSGSIPSEIDQLHQLVKIDLGHNGLTGTIPSEIGSLIDLEFLLLHKNRFTGSIPIEIGKCAELRELHIHLNLVEGTIPVELFECRKLTTLYCFFNKFTGTIPSNVGNLQSLLFLGLGNNQLSGTIPSLIGHMSSLIYLYLHNNDLTGQVPEELFDNNSLQLIWVYGNMLTGALPTTFTGLENMKFVDVSNNYLTGSVPSAFWNFESIIRLNLQNNLLTGNVPDDVCNNMQIGEIFRVPYPKTELKFDNPWFTETVADLQVDDSMWFMDNPKVDCSCCSTSSCYLWDITNTKTTARCPSSNILNFRFFKTYDILDYSVDAKLFQILGSVFRDANACLSPSGCYNVSYIENEDDDDIRQHFPFGYSSSSQTLMRHDGCDAVDVCGSLFAWDHPKRKILNHITQLAVPNLSYLNDPSLPEYKALCWLMTEDTLSEDFMVCDGSLLQRYTMIYLYNAQGLEIDLLDLASKHTCKWPGVSCGSSNKYVEVLDLSGQELQGSLVSEIGLLTRLKVIDLSSNSLKGSIDQSIFTYLPHLEVFDIGSNRFGGEIPHDLLSLPQLKDLRLSNNNFVGTLPSNIDYAKNIAHIEVRDNLLQGMFPHKLMECHKLKYIDLSRNNFEGRIPTGIGGLQYLSTIILNENHFSGSIPLELFNSKQIEVLMLQSNEITGTIPSHIANLKNITTITLNHNALKGTIPSEIENLKKLELMHLHMNQLVGQAPNVTFIDGLEHNQYIADCGDPSYHLPKLLNCPSCTMCCNSLEKCQENKELNSRFWIIAIFGLPIATTFIRFVIVKAGIDILHVFDEVERDPLHMHTLDSVYCFILTKSIVAWIIYFITAVIQVLLFAEYIAASDVKNENTDWQFTFRCPKNTVECEDESSRSHKGWILFFLVTGTYLGADFVKSLQQLQKAVLTLNWQLLLSGFFLFCLTMLALFASTVYNIALAESNTDLIMNTVILLFINDMDEKILFMLQSFAPEWTSDRIGDASIFASTRKRNLQPLRKAISRRISRLSAKFNSDLFKESQDCDNVACSDAFISNEKSLEEHYSDNMTQKEKLFLVEDILMIDDSVEIQIPLEARLE